MYSLKKTMLNILIGIAAAGVATADDTSASSVSLSLSLTNVVPSNKAGKQPKAGKQVKAAVGKAVKAKAFKDDSSLSYSMSMSYGPEFDPDSEAAELIFPVRYIGRQFGRIAIADSRRLKVAPGARVYHTSVVQSIAEVILSSAYEFAWAEGVDVICDSHISLAVDNDAALKRLYLYRDESDVATDLNLKPYLDKVIGKVTSLPNITVSFSAARFLNTYTNIGFAFIASEAIDQAVAVNAPKILPTHVQLGIVKALSTLGAPADTIPTLNALRDKLTTNATFATEKWFANRS